MATELLDRQIGRRFNLDPGHWSPCLSKSKLRPVPEDGLAIMLALQLAASIATAIGWSLAARSPEPRAIRVAAFLTCAWFALFAGLLAYLFDTDLIWFVPSR